MRLFWRITPHTSSGETVRVVTVDGSLWRRADDATHGRLTCTEPAPCDDCRFAARCALNGFTVARVERGEPIETHDLETRAQAEVALRAAAAAA